MAAKLFLSIALAICIGVFWLYFFQKKSQFSYKDIFRFVLYGCFSAIPLIAITHAGHYFHVFDPIEFIKECFEHNSRLAFICVFLFIGLIEEILKFFCLHKSIHRRKNIKTPGEVFFVGAFIAIGFAFLENILYFEEILNLGNLMSIMAVFAVRGGVSTLGHVVFTGIIGYKHGQIHLQTATRKKIRFSLRSFNKEAQPKIANRFKKYQLLFNCMFFGIILHSSFNYLAHLEMSYLNVLLLVGGFVWIRKNVFVRGALLTS